MNWLDSWKAAYPYIANKSTGIKLGDYEDAKRKYLTAYGQANPYSGPTGGFGFSAQDWISGNQPTGQDYDTQAQKAAWEQAQQEAWSKMLTPEQAAEYEAQKKASYKKNQRLGQLAFLGAVGGMAAPGILGALGGASGAGAGAGAAAAEGLGAGAMGAEGLGGLGGLGMFGTDLTAGGLAGMVGETGGLGGLEWLGGLGGASGAGFGGAGALGGLGGIGDALSKYGPDVLKLLGGGGGGSTPGGGGGGGNGLINTGLGLTALSAIMGLRNKQNLPAVPDFLKLAQQTADSQNQQLQQQTLANRPNQTNALGDQLKWSQGPGGQWNQTVSLSAPNQQRVQQQQQMAAALRGQIMNQQKNPAALPAMDNFAWGN